MNVCNYENRCKKFKEKTCPLLNSAETDPFCIKLFKIGKLQDEALLSEKQREFVPLRLDASGVDKEAFDRLKYLEDHVEQFVESGDNLYIYSSTCGNSKTLWSLRLLNRYFERIWYKSGLRCRGLFINISNLFITLKESLSQPSDVMEHIKKNIFDADLVVWDDIATKGFTTFETENLFNFINGRLQNGKANIYTSNLLGEDLKNSIGDRLYSRVENMSEIIILKGSDKRGLILT